MTTASATAKTAPPRYHATAEDVSGDCAAIAYAVERTAPGPNGEWRQAFIVVTRDAGATWSCLPLVKTMASCFRFWGFPVWPPERVDAVAIEREGVSIRFRDDWVAFEPGGESLWTARCSARGIWAVQRVRRLDYEGPDSPRSPPPIVASLPAGIRPPPVELLDPVALRLASDTRARVADRISWPLAFAFGIPVAFLGGGWWLLSMAPVYLVGLPVLSVLIERRRHRRTVAGTGTS